MGSMKGPASSERTVPPRFGTTLALIQAGGGPSGFKTMTLIEALAGSHANLEVARLVRRNGAAAVKTFVVTFDFVVADALRVFKRRHLGLRAQRETDSPDGKVLAADLYAAGTSKASRAFRVETLLDSLFSVGVHDRIMHDVGAAYGPASDATYHRVLEQLVTDLHADPARAAAAAIDA